MDSRKWPDSACGVIKQRRQFSWYNTAKQWMPEEELEWIEYIRARSNSIDRKALFIAIDLAEAFYYSRPFDDSDGATHYMTWDLWTRNIVKWGKGNICLSGKIGDHVFFNSVGRAKDRSRSN